MINGNGTTTNGTRQNQREVRTIEAIAADYARLRGWKPVPVDRKSKKAIGKGWQKRAFAPEQFDGNRQNVAIQLGAVSGGLVDVDLDSTTAIGLAPEFLPPTDAIFGHRSKPCSHQLYVSDLHQTEKQAAIQYKDGDAIIVELRIGGDGKGATTVFPPSMHTTGEMVEWANDGEPARVPGNDLKRAVVRLAVACLLVRHYPGKESRHKGALVIGGVLARAGWSADEIGHLVKVVARSVEDEEWSDRVETAAGAVDVKANGHAVPGAQRLRDVWGENTATTLGKWLDLRGAQLKIDGGSNGVSIADFHAYMPMHSYIFVPSRDLWPAASVNARIPPLPLLDAAGSPVLDEDKGKPKTIAASAWLDQNKPIEQMTWAPGQPMVIPDRLVSDGGWIERPGCKTFNLYQAPTLVLGNARDVEPWLDHCHRLLGDDAEHVIKWLAHRVQRPHEKINHAIVLGGAQGIGKDTLLEPVKHAVGPWNLVEVSPQHLLGRFNGFVKSVILRISEARDLGDADRFAFYDHMKAYIAAPPDVLRVDEKNLREYAVFNVTGVIITTNHKVDGIFLPSDDRRHFVAWSSLTKADFSAGYWSTIWSWYQADGIAKVAAYLHNLDISSFDPKAPPPKTQAFFEIVDSSRAPEDAELADALDLLGWPDVVTVERVANHAAAGFAEWLRDRKNARRIPHRFEECDYVAVRNPNDKGGRWKISGRRHTIYAKAALPMRDRIAAVYEYTGTR